MKKLLLIIGFTMTMLGIRAQQSYDYGLFLGLSQSHLHTILPIPVPGTLGYAGGAYYRYNLNPRYALRGGVNAGLNVATTTPDFFEGYGLFEFNFHALNPRRENAKISPYVATGISYLVDMNLISQIQNSTSPTGQFWLRNIRIPFNLGLRYNALPNLTLGFEWDLRKGYQKDWSDPENPVMNFLNSNWKSHVGFTLGYTVVKTCKTCPFYDKERNKRR
jgi:hypothetical protein